MDECKPLPTTARAYSPHALDSTAWGQGLTLVHFSAQRERFEWDRESIWGCLEGV